MSKVFFKAFAVSLIIFLTVNLIFAQDREIVTSDSAMVVSAHPLASEVGLDVLQKGGNAVDAAIAVQFALSVVYPRAGNIGGGGFMVVRTDSSNYALDFREKAPVLATPDMFLDGKGNVRPLSSTHGHLASGVPGTVDGMVRAHERFGSLPWEELIQPAIDLALNGFPLTEREAQKLNQNVDQILRINTVKPDFLKQNYYQTGDTIRFDELGLTLTRILNNKRDGFYDGETARLIMEEMKRGGGIINRIDLENYQSVWRDPYSFWYKNYKVITMPPPSSGGVALHQLFQIMERYPIGEWGFHDSLTVHLMIEAERRVFADRAAYLGDPDFVDVPAEILVDSVYLAGRMENFDTLKATPSKLIYAGEMPEESTETTHFSIVDKWGNAVAVTTTLNGNYGSKVVVGGAGFFLNNEMDDFSVKVGEKNMFGLVGGSANVIEPEKRMLSSMTPTILEKDSSLYMVLGSPGGPMIITTVFQTILNVIEFEMNMQQAVEAGRFHHQWKPDQVYLEIEAFDDELVEQLRSMGHKFKMRREIGSVDAILIRDDGKLEGGADPRGDDTAKGY
jgi:gamma-glutamyltranspeptidase/glutathione hydrolase